MISYIYKRVRDGGHFAYTVLGIDLYIYIYKMYLLFRLDERMRRRPHPVFWDHRQRLSGADPGGGGRRARAPLSESLVRSRLL